MKEEFGKIVYFTTSSKLALILALEIIFSFFLWLISFFIFIKLGEDVFQKEIISFDNTFMDLLYQFRSPELNTLMMNITFLGSSIFLLCLSVIAIIYIYSRRKKDALIFSSILYTGVIINLVLKEIFHRPRPDLYPLIHEVSFSFPSGHAMNSFVFYSAISYFVWRSTRNIKLTILTSSISLVLILIIGFSRIYLGVHYPSDVIAGFTGGLVWLVSAILFEKTIIFERLFRSAQNNIYAKKQ